MQKKKKRRGSSFIPGHKTNLIYNEPLSKSVSVGFTKTQYEKLKTHCDRHGIKISALIRDLVDDFLNSAPDP